jgi:hypothetical protein
MQKSCSHCADMAIDDHRIAKIQTLNTQAVGLPANVSQVRETESFSAS